jgi:ABC-2 type transport system permease protein/lipopolysaccharide transport system permease protein
MERCGVIRAVRELWRYRELARILVAKELKLRYRRSVLGFGWTMLNPLVTMVILASVFTHVMRVQIDAFPVFVLSALLPWNFFVQSIVGGAMSIIHNESLLRNVRIPRAIIPIALTLSHLVNLLLALIPLVLVMFWQGVPIRPSVLALPWFLVCLWAFTTGIVLVLSVWTVSFRDLGQIVEVSLTALFYLTPILYPLSLLPERFAGILRSNPLVPLILPFRALFLDGVVPDLSAFAAAGVIGVASFAIGLAVFRSRENQLVVLLS